MRAWVQPMELHTEVHHNIDVTTQMQHKCFAYAKQQVQELTQEHPKESDCGGFISIYVVIVEVLYWSLFDILVTFTCI